MTLLPGGPYASGLITLVRVSWHFVLLSSLICTDNSFFSSLICCMLPVCILLWFVSNKHFLKLKLKVEVSHWGWDKMAAILQTAVLNVFSWMKMYKSQLKFHWSSFIEVLLTIFQHWLRQWLGTYQATSHYLNHWLLVYCPIYASLGLNELSWNILVSATAELSYQLLYTWSKMFGRIKCFQGRCFPQVSGQNTEKPKHRMPKHRKPKHRKPKHRMTKTPNDQNTEKYFDYLCSCHFSTL